MAPSHRVIVHLDADCFFASIEIAENPKLKGKQVCVCTRLDNRGIVVSATYQMRKLGIHAGMPLFKARGLLDKPAVFIKGHHAIYDIYSHRMFKIVKEFSPDCAITSIDEGFIDITGLRLLYRTSYEGIAKMMQERIFHDLNIPVSFGIAGTKLLAKLASKNAKPFGIRVISEMEREDFLKTVRINDVTGIGPNISALLQKYGYKTAFQFAREKKEVIYGMLGKRGEALFFELNGQPVTDSSESKNAITSNFSYPKSLSHSHTFHEFLMNKGEIFTQMLKLLLSLLQRLRSYGMKAKKISIILVEKKFLGREAAEELHHHSWENADFIKILKRLFPQVFYKGEIGKPLLYRKAGVILTDLMPETQTQPSLFQEETPQKEVSKTLDYMEKKYKKQVIFPGRLLIPPKRY